HLERGDGYFKREQYREAIIEYWNVLRIDPLNLQAVRQAGLVHYRLGELGPAFTYLRKAAELDPAHIEVRQRLHAISLLGGRLADARQEADRKSTRLNSSHEWISYAVFCLKK